MVQVAKKKKKEMYFILLDALIGYQTAHGINIRMYDRL
jgi:hypothetical protein